MKIIEIADERYLILTKIFDTYMIMTLKCVLREAHTILPEKIIIRQRQKDFDKSENSVN
jgi:hypothetical protein